MPVKPNLVEQLERLIERAIADVLDSQQPGQLPVKPRREVAHLMAKAAVAVYEGVVEGREVTRPPGGGRRRRPAAG